MKRFSFGVSLVLAFALTCNTWAARLPNAGEKNWGAVLNEYLLVSLNIDGTLKAPVVFMTNKAGAGVSAYDVVVLDTSNDSAFTTTTSLSNVNVIGVAQADIANNAAGNLATQGKTTVNLKSGVTVTRGDYLITSTEAGKADRSATYVEGAFARALTGGTGTVTALLLYQAEDFLEAATKTITGQWSFGGNAFLYFLRGDGSQTSYIRNSATGASGGDLTLSADGSGAGNIYLRPGTSGGYTLADQKMLIGSLGVAPDTTLHVFRGDSSQNSHSQAGMTLEDNDTVYFQFLTGPGDFSSGLMFGDVGDPAQGMIFFSHSDNSFSFRTDGVNDYVKINSSDQLVSTLATGTAPLVVASTTLVTNLNADMVDGYHAGNGASQVLLLDGSGLVPLADIPATLTGKDADTLDGQHGAYYNDADNLANDTVSGFIGGSTTYIDDDGVLGAAFFVSGNMSEGSWESVGPTGSGATNIWTSMDSVPTNAKAILLKVWIALYATGGLGESAVFTRKTGSSAAANAATMIASFYGGVETSGFGSYPNSLTHVIVPIDGNLRFDTTWTDGATGSELYLYIEGWIE